MNYTNDARTHKHQNIYIGHISKLSGIERTLKILFLWGAYVKLQKQTYLLWSSDTVVTYCSSHGSNPAIAIDLQKKRRYCKGQKIQLKCRVDSTPKKSWFSKYTPYNGWLVTSCWYGAVREL